MESQAHTIASGFAHSCAIGPHGQLYVWGDNTNEQLVDKTYAQRCQPKNQGEGKNGNIIPEPIPIKLQYKSEYMSMVTGPQQSGNILVNAEAGIPGSDYKATDVAAGPFCTFAIGCQQQGKTFIQVEEPVIQEILDSIQKILLKNKTLINLFYGNNNSVSNQEGWGGSFEDADESNKFRVLLQQDPFTLEIPKETFIEKLIQAGICSTDQFQQAEDLARIIKEHREKSHELGAGGQSSDDCLILGDIEDFALGFLQNNIKLFLFGQAHKALRSFERETDELSELLKQGLPENKVKKKSDYDDANEAKVAPKPIAIVFPKFTKPLISVAVGSAHALALTIDQEMYSWGAGIYGALGFGEQEDCPNPRRLDIKDHKNQSYKITQICCGKFHSMCLTSRQNLFSWGDGSQGRLGHGDVYTDDQLAPKEIYSLSQRKPVFVAAGESHSAAITEKHQLFTWGNGGFGRLGHGSDNKETSPKLVEQLQEHEIAYVALGSLHTLAVSSQGIVFSFGQNKYGKLGIHYSNSKDGQIHKEPVKISMYLWTDEGPKPSKKKNDIVQVAAGFNHSLALSKEGKAYSWGYKGKGSLGRLGGDNRLALPVGPSQQGSMRFHDSLSQEQQAFMRTYVRMKNGEFSDTMEKPLIEQDKCNKNMEEQNLAIKQLCCGSANTVALTSIGEVYVLGNNLYGQHAREEIKVAPITLTNTEGYDPEYEVYDLTTNVSLIRFPFQNLDKVQYVACGGEHLFAQSALDEIYAWGRNDEGQLGIGFLSNKVTEPFLIKDLSYKGIKQISCGDNYSAAVTVYGEVFVAGSQEGGKLGLGKGQRRGYQLNFKYLQKLPEIDYVCCGVDHMLAISRKTDDPKSGSTYAWGKNHRGQLGLGSKDNQYSPCEIMAKEKLQKVCCGFDFSLGLTFTNKVYFWGNNNNYPQTQKVLTKDIDEPTVIQYFEYNTVWDIACNYMQSYALVDKGEIKQWGKFVQEKEEGARGAIRNKKNNKETGADESEQAQCTPSNIKCSLANSKAGVQFESIVTGENHSCAISQNQKAYVWGFNNVNNRLGVRNLQETGAARAGEPQEIGTLHDIMDHQREHANGNHHDHDHSDGHDEDSFEMEDDGQSAFEDVIEESERKMAEELKGMDEEEVDTVDPEEVELEEQYNNQTPGEAQNLEQTFGGNKKTPAPGGGPGGSKVQGQPGKQQEQMQISGAAGGSLSKQAVNQIYANGPISSGDFCEMFLSQVEAYNQRAKKGKGKASKGHGLSVFDQNVDLYTLEYIRQEIQTRQSPNLVNLLKQSEQDLIRANILLQKILKKEEGQGLDEETISDLDYDVSKTTANMILQVAQFSKFQSQNNGLILTSKTSFLGRAVENPFNIDIALSHQLKYKGMDAPIVKHKKDLQRIFTLFVTHPCYIVKLLKSGLLDYGDQKLLIKQLFSSGKKTITLRNNYFLISIFEQMLQHDLKGKKLQQVNLIDPECKMISVYIFRRVFKSKQTNLETVSSIAAHILNLILALSQGQGGAGEDDTLDVLNETGGTAGGPGDKGGQAAEKPTGGTPAQKATALLDLVRKVIEDILNNLVLREAAQYFAFKKKTTAQLDFIKKQFKDFQEERAAQNNSSKHESAKQSQVRLLAGIDAENIKDKFPSLRFSEEITVMVDILDRQLRSLDSASGSKDEDVCNQVLGLIFNPNLHKIQDNLPLYIYPYLSKVKMVNFVGEQLQEVHANNIKNAFITVINYMNGQPVFKQGSTENESWNQILNQKLLQHQQTYKIKILNQIQKYGAEVDSILSYKNFEHLVAHCLEQDDTKISISKKLVGILYQRLANYTNEIVIFSPSRNDPLFQIVHKIIKDQQGSKEGLQGLAKLPDYAERVNLKLKTRLMIQDSLESAQIEKFVRCTNCHATLQQDVAVQNYDENIVLSQYEPQGAQNLVTAFCEVLRNVEEINPDLLSGGQQKKDDNVGLFDQGGSNQIKGGMKEFIRITAQTAKREAKHKKSKMIQDFETNLEIEVDGLKNKNAVKGRADDNARDLEHREGMDLTDEVFSDLLSQAEKKMNDRIRQKFNLKLIQVHVERHMKPMIQAKISSFKNQLMEKNQLKSDNYQWGLANRDLLHLWDSPNLIQMNRVRAFTIGQKMSQSLNKNLGSEQKQNIRGYLQIDCKKLLENGTIRKARLVELEPMLPMCHCVLIESDRGQQVEFKLVFRQTKYNPCGANKVLQEQILLSFNISPQKLKAMRQQKAKDSAMSTKNGDEEEEGLVFEENDALEFDPDGFLKLLTQMERQKAAYSLLEDNNDGTTSSKKRKSKSRKK